MLNGRIQMPANETIFGCSPIVNKIESSCRHVVYALQAARIGFRFHSLSISR
jgi:hypothetical protein